MFFFWFIFSSPVFFLNPKTWRFTFYGAPSSAFALRWSCERDVEPHRHLRFSRFEFPFFAQKLKKTKHIKQTRWEAFCVSNVSVFADIVDIVRTEVTSLSCQVRQSKIIKANKATPLQHTVYIIYIYYISMINIYIYMINMYIYIYLNVGSWWIFHGGVVAHPKPRGHMSLTWWHLSLGFHGFHGFRFATLPSVAWPPETK